MDQLKNAKLYGCREDFINTLEKNLDILEVGTGGGDYANLLLTITNPKRLDLVDTFNEKDAETVEDIKLERFISDSHFDFVKNRFINETKINLFKADSVEFLPKIKNKYDYIYIDANHTFEFVEKDLYNATKILKDGGIIGLNDYADKGSDKHNIYLYGVISAVNFFLDVNRDWEVIGFALHGLMFCDIYLKKINKQVNF
jgi:spermidine synthase